MLVRGNRLANSLFRTGTLDVQAITDFPHPLTQLIGDGLGQGSVAIGDGDHGWSHLGDVGVGKARHDADREHPRALLGLSRQGHQRTHRFPVGLLAEDVDHHGGLGDRRDRANRSRGRPRHQLGRLQTAGSLVDMGIGLIADQGIAQRIHSPGHVGMIIERGDDRQRITDRGTNPAEHLGVSVRMPSRHHRAVEGQQQAFDLPLVHALGDVRDDLVENLVGDRPGGGGPGHDGRHDLESKPRGALEEPAHFMMGLAPDRLDRRAPGEAALDEASAVRHVGRKRVRFVHDSADGNAHGMPFCS